MTAFDYTRPLATAQRLIARFGRVVALQGVSNGPDDANDPLAGPADPPDPITGIPAAFVQPSSLNMLGYGQNFTELFKSATQIALIAPINGSNYDDMQFLIDGATTWKITHIEKLMPASIPVLYFIGVASP